MSRTHLSMRLQVAPITGAIAVWLAGCGEPQSPALDVSQLRGDPINPVSLTATGQEPANTNAEPPETKPPVQVNPPSSENNLSSRTSSPDSIIPIEPDPLPLVQEWPGEDENEDYLEVGFDQLAGYKIEISDEILNPFTNALFTVSAENQIPKEIKNLDQKWVRLKGFMLPMKVEGGLVTELLLMKDQSLCCFGATPRINDWVSIKMNDKGVKPLMDQPVTFFGRLKVGEMRENGYLVGIYAMEGESMAGPLDF